MFSKKLKKQEKKTHTKVTNTLFYYSAVPQTLTYK